MQNIRKTNIFLQDLLFFVRMKYFKSFEFYFKFINFKKCWRHNYNTLQHTDRARWRTRNSDKVWPGPDRKVLNETISVTVHYKEQCHVKCFFLNCSKQWESRQQHCECVAKHAGGSKASKTSASVRTSSSSWMRCRRAAVPLESKDAVKYRLFILLDPLWPESFMQGVTKICCLSWLGHWDRYTRVTPGRENWNRGERRR